MYVLDATPLIVLAKADRLELLPALDEPCCTTERVYDEVVTAGIEEGHADARRVERAVESERLAVREAEATPLFDRLLANEKLSTADASVVATAGALDATAVMDEQYGRSVADAESVDVRGTAYLVLRSQKQGRIDAAEARATIDDLLDAGWYCAPDLYARIRQKIDEFADG